MSTNPLKSMKSATLYERLGGEAGIATIIDQFYDRVLHDPELAPFFLHTSMEKLLRMQREFFGAALEGPQTYSGLDLTHAHSGRGITTPHFTRFVRHLLETLETFGVSPKDVNAVVSRIAMYADDITGGGTDSE